MQPPIDWLLSGPAWIQYRTRRDLLNQADDIPEVIVARQAMLADPQIQAIIAELADWPGVVISSHKSAGQPYHKLNFLADLGLRVDDPGIDHIAERVMAHVSKDGPFQLPLNIPVHFGGTGDERWAWALCDAPLLVYALIKLGLGDHPQVQRAMDHLTTLVRENGWPCAVSPELGSFRGPGKKSDPCPYANLAMLKALGQVTALRDGPAARTGVETLLGAWEHRRDQHPYMFYAGTDFCKLKAPLIWYDILHVLDVLSLFTTALPDPRFKEMLQVVTSKANHDGAFVPESIYTYWKGWEFGQKGLPSRWISLLVYRIQRRAEIST
jgi:hypothetical protein